MERVRAGRRETAVSKHLFLVSSSDACPVRKVCDENACSRGSNGCVMHLTAGATLDHELQRRPDPECYIHCLWFYDHELGLFKVEHSSVVVIYCLTTVLIRRWVVQDRKIDAVGCVLT